MEAAFTAAMAKMAIIGHSRSNLIDCSEVIPPASTVPVKGAQYVLFPWRSVVLQ